MDTAFTLRVSRPDIFPERILRLRAQAVGKNDRKKLLEIG